jgi:hypothetical protein
LILEVFTALWIWVVVFWAMAPCSLVVWYQQDCYTSKV